MDFVPTVAMLALVVKVIDVLRYATNRDVNSIITQATAWIAGIIAVALAAHTTWAGGIIVAGIPLDHLGVWSQIFAGLSVSSVGSLTKDGITALDRTTCARTPSLLPDTSTGQHAAQD